MPVVVLLEPRAHFGEPGDLPTSSPPNSGVLIARIDRAVRSVGEIGRGTTASTIDAGSPTVSGVSAE